MTSFESLIANHFYINLDRRNDRMISCERELKKIGLDRPNRFSAIENKVGIVGCGFSHLKCIETAKKENLPYVCIFEDDIIIPKPNQVKNTVNRILESGVDWDVLCLAGNPFLPHKEVKDDYVVINRMYCGTAYIVKQSFYDALIDNIRKGLMILMKTGNRDYSWDCYWIKLQMDRRYRFLLIKPLTIYQKPDYSDIEGTNVDYKELMLNIDK